jgi:hypothetical protein
MLLVIASVRQCSVFSGPQGSGLNVLAQESVPLDPGPKDLGLPGTKDFGPHTAARLITPK